MLRMYIRAFSFVKWREKTLGAGNRAALFGSLFFGELRSAAPIELWDHFSLHALACAYGITARSLDLRLAVLSVR